MHHRLFANQRNLGPSELPAHAEAVGLDATAFRQCLDSGKHAARVRSDLSEGQRAGVMGTPTFFLGTMEPGDSTVKVIRVLKGAQPYAAFKAAIDGALSTLR